VFIALKKVMFTKCSNEYHVTDTAATETTRFLARLSPHPNTVRYVVGTVDKHDLPVDRRGDQYVGAHGHVLLLPAYHARP
jgi:hypothetical protein